jgi:hypothetical protein
MEAEKAAIHAEYEQERIAYQRLIKDYHRVEQQCENLQARHFVTSVKSEILLNFLIPFWKNCRTFFAEFFHRLNMELVY